MINATWFQTKYKAMTVKKMWYWHRHKNTMAKKDLWWKE